MYVPKQLPGVAVAAAVSQERIVVEDDGLAPNADSHLLSNMLETLHEAPLSLLHVMVPQDEVYPSVQAAQDLVPFLRSSEREVSEVKHHPFRWNGLVPPADEFLVHFQDGSEGTPA